MSFCSSLVKRGYICKVADLTIAAGVPTQSVYTKENCATISQYELSGGSGERALRTIFVEHQLRLPQPQCASVSVRLAALYPHSIRNSQRHLAPTAPPLQPVAVKVNAKEAQTANTATSPLISSFFLKTNEPSEGCKKMGKRRRNKTFFNSSN